MNLKPVQKFFKQWDKEVSQMNLDEYFAFFSKEQMEVLEIIADHMGLKKEYIFINNRKQELAMARHVFRYYLHKTTKMTESYIGAITVYGGTDHTSVINSIKVTKAMIETNFWTINNLMGKLKFEFVEQKYNPASVVLKQIKESIVEHNISICC